MKLQQKADLQDEKAEIAEKNQNYIFFVNFRALK